ncbi:MAG: IPT/TIG domain-containing protein [Actinomycetota bacterium]|nr:IPT/TIG domain-containing protein [Actinomycetota bacterium]
MISALSPSSGVAGETVTVTGQDFFSADGRIVVRFGGVVVPTRCPDQSTCVVTVPAAVVAGAPPPAVAVTLTTDAGMSNALAFRYG